MLDTILQAARRRIEVSDEELHEARQRRNAIAAALKREFPGSRSYHNGSVAHGDALTPLTDVDTGIVVHDPDGEYGLGAAGPAKLKERAAEAIRRELKADYGDLAVEVKGRKRSILVRFRDPVTAGQPDFTADVIVAIDNTSGVGLYIPRYDGWDRSDPEEHTRLIHAANAGSEAAYARVVRLVKHWNRTHGKPLCSWNIKALALGCITSPANLIDGLRAWFAYAVAELALGETEDPAGVAPHPIKLNETRTETVRRLRNALETLDYAIELEMSGYPILAADELARLFNDTSMLPHPDRANLMAEQAAKILAEKSIVTSISGAPALLTGTTSQRDRINVQSWSE